MNGRRSNGWRDPWTIVHAAHPLLIPSRHAAQIVTIHDLFFLDHPERVRDEIRRDYHGSHPITPAVQTRSSPRRFVPSS
jgi:hypothetical protein